MSHRYLILAALCSAAALAPSPQAHAAPSPQQLAELAEIIEAERVQLGAPGVAFAYFEDGRILFSRGFGSAHPGEDVPVNGDTLFRMGSVNKMLTSIGALQQVEAGRIDPNAPITDVIPDFVLQDDPAVTGEMTLEYLISHQGGLTDFLTLRGNPNDRGLERFLTGTFARTQYAQSPPGEFWNYANPNFSVAGLMIEEASGQFYPKYMNENVFGPLGMQRTVLKPEEALALGNYATGLSIGWEDDDGQPFVAPDAYDCAWTRPAGYAFTSVNDLARLAQFFIDGNNRVLSNDTREAMMQSHVSLGVYGDEAGYGHGLFRWEGLWVDGQSYPTAHLEHGGAIPGFAASVAFLPEMNRGVAVLANTDGAYLSEAMAYAMTMSDLPDPEPIAVPAPQPSTFPSLVGWYADPRLTVGPMHIEGDRNGLTATFPLLDRSDIPYDPELIPVTKDNFLFYLQGYGFILTFFYDDGGEVEWVRSRYWVSVPAGDEPDLRSLKPMSEAQRQQLMNALREAADVDGRILKRGGLGG